MRCSNEKLRIEDVESFASASSTMSSPAGSGGNRYARNDRFASSTSVVGLRNQLLTRTGDSFRHHLIATRVGMDLVALQRWIRQNAFERPGDEKATFVARDSRIHLLVIRRDARE